MQKLDEEGNQKSMIVWTSLVMKDHEEFTFKKYIKKLIHPTMSMLTSLAKPRISEEIMRILHLMEQEKILGSRRSSTRTQGWGKK